MSSLKLIANQIKTIKKELGKEKKNKKWMRTEENTCKNKTKN